MSLLTELMTSFGIGRVDLLWLISTAPARYKVYEIDKRRGGTRRIAQPSRELKEIQRFVLQEKLAYFPIHPAATGYVKGRGIQQNAEAHRAASVILKLDFTEFFPSIVAGDWEKLVRNSGVDRIEVGDLPLYTKILFWGREKKSTTPRCLSIGAPTSPAMSNIIMYALDVQLVAAAERFQVTYTRYADDITVSAGDALSLLRFEAAAKRIVGSSKSPRLSFNDDKRGLYHRGQRRMVTGLVITPTGEISLGRARKREMSSLLHRSQDGLLAPDRRGYLKGMLGFALAHEPAFVERMRAKYGDGTVDAALKYFVPAHSV